VLWFRCDVVVQCGVSYIASACIRGAKERHERLMDEELNLSLCICMCSYVQRMQDGFILKMVCWMILMRRRKRVDGNAGS